MELARIVEADYVTVPVDDASLDAAHRKHQERTAACGDVAATGTQMREAAKKFEFEKAANSAIASAH